MSFGFVLVSVSSSSLITHVQQNRCDGQKVVLHRGDELELELIQTQMAQKPILRAEVGMRVRCANKASVE